MPLCRKHHQEQHDIGVKSFEAKYAVCLKRIAKDLYKEFIGYGK